MSLTDTNFQSQNEAQQSNHSQQGNQIVVNCHNLCPDHFNCDRLFNLMSLYGNVDKVID